MMRRSNCALGFALLASLLPAQDRVPATQRFFDARDVSAKCTVLAEMATGGIDSAPLTPWLAELLGDPRPAIREAAAAALAELAPHAGAALPILDAHLATHDDPELQRIARALIDLIAVNRRRDATAWREELATRGAGAVPALLDALGRDRFGLAELFGPLARLVTEVDQATARRILMELRSRQAREAVEALAATLRGERCPPELRGEMLELLGQLAPVDDPRFDAVFLEALGSDDSRTRSNAARALSERLRLRPGAGVEAWLAQWRAERDPNHRQHLLQCWWDVPRVPAGLAEAIAPGMLVDGDGYPVADLVARAGTDAGVVVFRRMLESEALSRSRPRRVATRSLARYGARAVPAIEGLCAAVLEPDPEIAVEAVRALARIPSAVSTDHAGEVGSALRSAMQHPHAAVRRVAAAAAIARTEPDPPTALALLDLLDDPDPGVSAAARVLAPSAGPMLATALEPAPLGPKAARLRDALRAELSETPGTRLATIRRALACDDADVCEAVFAALARPSRALPEQGMLELLRDTLAEPRATFAAARAADVAARLGPEALPLVAELAGCARHQEPLLRDAARHALEALGPGRDVAVVEAIRTARGARRAALLELLRTPNEVAWNVVTAACGDSEPAVRAAARDAVERFLAVGSAPPTRLVDVETIAAWRERLEAARRDPPAAAETLLEIAAQAPEPICIEALALLATRTRQPDRQRRAGQVALELLRTGSAAQRDGAFGLLLQARLLEPGDWFTALCDPDPWTRRRAGLLNRLADQRPPSATLHAGLVDDPLPSVRRALAGALRQLDAAAAAPIAERFLIDGDPLVRNLSWAWFVAKERAPVRIGEAFELARRSPARAAPRNVLDVLARHPDGASLLLDVLQEEPDLWRGEAIATLHRLGRDARAALEPIRALLTEGDTDTVRHAAEAIAAMDWPADAAELRSLADPLDLLLANALDGQTDCLGAVAWLVVARGSADRATIDALRRVPGDAKVETREAVAHALLAAVDDPDALRTGLRRVLDAASVRPLAVDELAAAATRPAAVDALTDVLREHLTTAAPDLLPQWYVAATDLAARASPASRTRLVGAVLDHLVAVPLAHTDHRWAPLLIATGPALPELLWPRLADPTTRQRLGPGLTARFVVDPNAFTERYADATDDPDLRARMLAAAQARATSHPDALLRLAKSDLDAADAALRLAAWNALSHSGRAAGELVAARLAAALEQGDVPIPSEILNALAALGPDADAAVPLLVSAFDREFLVAEQLASLLAALGPRGITMLEVIRPAGVDLVALLVAHADEPTLPASRIAALRALVRLEASGKAVAELCVRAVHSPDPEVRTWSGLLACRAVATEPTALPAVRTALEHSDARQRINALEAIVRVEPPSQVVPVLAERLLDPAPTVREVACRALGRLGRLASPAQGALRGLLTDPDTSVREAAAAALSRID